MIDASLIWQYLEGNLHDLSLSNEVLLDEIDCLREAARFALDHGSEELRRQLGWPSGKHGAYPSPEWPAAGEHWLPSQLELSPQSSGREWKPVG